MIVDKYSIEGAVVGQVELSDNVFNAVVNDVLIYELIKSANANLRQGNSSTKMRSELKGGGSRPWRQKGTGRARHGTVNSPLWRGGGVVFGPKPRDYKIDLPKAIKRSAYRSLLSLKAKEGAIKVVEDFEIAQGKTKEIAQIGKVLSVEKGVLITDREDALLKRSIRNIPWFFLNNVKRLSSRDIFYSKTIVITESAVKYLNEKYA
jgi:large subunit ribosomal protein L4